MPKSRKITRENRKAGKREEALDNRNQYGISDPTPQQAVKRLMKKEGSK